MRPFEDMRAAFSRYELAVMGYILTLVLGVAAVVLFGLGNMGGGLILFLIAAVVLISFLSISECPTCGKAPLNYYPLGKEGWLGRWPWGQKLWPERVCSSCGTRLDGI